MTIPNGTLLCDNAAALNYANRLIRERKEGGRYNDPNPWWLFETG